MALWVTDPAAAQERADYLPLPEGTSVSYSTWDFDVTKVEGKAIVLEGRSPTGRFINRRYGHFIKLGSDAYSSGSVHNWVTLIDDENMQRVDSLWPLEVGKSVTIDLQEDKLTGYYANAARYWQVELTVERTEIIDLNGDSYRTFVISERATSPTLDDVHNTFEAAESVTTRWYHPESGLILKAQRDIKSGPIGHEPEDYSLKRVSFPDGAKNKLVPLPVSAPLVSAVPNPVQEATPAPRVQPASLPTARGIEFGNYYALVIGNNDYRHLPKLKTAVNDAEAMSAVLEEQYGFNVLRLKDASREEIIDALDFLIETLTPQDNLLIYYAGHGWLDKSADQGYWLPVDAKENRRSRWISNTTISDTLRTLEAKHVMIVADSCFSGTLTRSAGVGVRTASYLANMVAKRTRIALVSGGLEPVSDGNGEHSPFAREMLHALNTNQAVMDGTTLFSMIRRPVMLAANQTPELSDVRQTGHDGGDFLFVRRR